MRKLLVILTLFLFACAKPAKETKQIGAFEVGLLFEHDGVKVYRFYDNGSAVYYIDKRGSVFHEETHTSGKHTHTDRIQSETEE